MMPHHTATPPANITNGPNQSSQVVRLDRRLVEDEVAVARDQVLLDLVVGLAGHREFANFLAQVGGEIGVAVGQRLVLADEAAQLALELLQPRCPARDRRAPGRGRRTARRTAARQERAATDGPHDFCSSRTSGRIFRLSASCGDRADLLVADDARLVDDEGLGHAVDAAVDADAPVAIDDRDSVYGSPLSASHGGPSAGLSL